MTTRKNILSEKTTDQDLVLARNFDATREAVFNAWTDPEALKRWWGPKSFTMQEGFKGTLDQLANYLANELRK
ncbi:MAG: SRPBCC domain-containing protein [Ignavibacteria bacterium]|nr:SRPBCC domain-containing protein [Ignavibacteria bacterium]